MAISTISTVDEAMEFAVMAIEKGEADKAKTALSWILQRDPRNGAAWLWMACCVSDETAKQECYRRAGA